MNIQNLDQNTIEENILELNKLQTQMKSQNANDLFMKYENKCIVIYSKLKTLKAIDQLVKQGIRAAPVVNRLNKTIVGVLDARDVVKYLIFNLSKQKEDIEFKELEMKKRQKSIQLLENDKLSRSNQQSIFNCSFLEQLFCCFKDKNQNVKNKHVVLEHDSLSSNNSRKLSFSHQQELDSQYHKSKQVNEPIEEEENDEQNTSVFFCCQRSFCRTQPIKNKDQQNEKIDQNKFQNNIEYLKQIERKMGQLLNLEYLARMHKYTVIKNDAKLSEVILAFAHSARNVGYHDHHNYLLTISSLKLCNQLYEEFNFKKNLPKISMQQFIDKDLIHELKCVYTTTSAQEIFQKLVEENLPCIGLKDIIKNSIVNIFSVTDVKYWLSQPEFLSLDTGGEEFLHVVRPANIQTDNGNLITIHSTDQLIDAIHSFKQYRIHRIPVKSKFGTLYHFSMADFQRFLSNESQ